MGWCMGGEKRHEVDACECAFGPHMCTGKQNMGTSSTLSTCELLKQRRENANLPSKRLWKIKPLGNILYCSFDFLWPDFIENLLTGKCATDYQKQTKETVQKEWYEWGWIDDYKYNCDDNDVKDDGDLDHDHHHHHESGTAKMMTMTMMAQRRSLNICHMEVRSLASSAFSPSGKIIVFLQFSCFCFSFCTFLFLFLFLFFCNTLVFSFLFLRSVSTPPSHQLLANSSIFCNFPSFSFCSLSSLNTTS